MRRRITTLVLAVLTALAMMAVPAAQAAQGSTALDRAENAGWDCGDIAGAMHCFDPGDGHSKNASTVNVKVYGYDGHFLGTEQIWSPAVYHGQPCPQDELLDLGPMGTACHHYSHD